MSGEQLRQIVEAEGRRIIAAQDAGALLPAISMLFASGGMTTGQVGPSREGCR